MKNTSNLVNYDEKSLEDIDIKIVKLSIILGIIISLVLLILCICKLISYQILLGYLLGLIVGCLLFIRITVSIKKTNYLSFKKKVKSMHASNLIIYSIALILIFLLTKNPFSLLACVAGIVTNKLAIYIFYLKGENK